MSRQSLIKYSRKLLAHTAMSPIYVVAICFAVVVAVIALCAIVIEWAGDVIFDCDRNNPQTYKDYYGY